MFYLALRDGKISSDAVVIVGPRFGEEIASHSSCSLSWYKERLSAE